MFFGEFCSGSGKVSRGSLTGRKPEDGEGPSRGQVISPEQVVLPLSGKAIDSVHLFIQHTGVEHPAGVDAKEATPLPGGSEAREKDATRGCHR